MTSVRSGPQDNANINWERKWSDENFSPWWMARGVPEEFSQALSKNINHSAESILDIGCGNGLMTCDLARDFASVSGVDFSPTAIILARENAIHLSSPPKFHVCDALRDIVPGGPFQIILDRGCLHLLGRENRRLYAANMHAQLNPTGHLFVLHKQDTSMQDLVDNVVSGLVRYFTLSKTTETEFSAKGTTLPAVFFEFRPHRSEQF